MFFFRNIFFTKHQNAKFGRIMKITIETIKIGPRIRQEVGDLTQLKRSIHEVGLLTPIIINEKLDLENDPKQMSRKMDYYNV